MSNFDIAKYGRFAGDEPTPEGAKRTQPTRQKGLFVRGPIPWDWLLPAARHRGRGLHLAIAIMFEAGMAGCHARAGKEWFKLRSFAVRDLGVDRHAEARALKWLEEKGLIRVARHRGRRPRIQVILQANRSSTTESPSRTPDEDGS